MSKLRVTGFTLESKIGSGTFAEVYKAHRCSSRKEVVAIKCIKKGELSPSTVESIITEIKTLKVLRHPHIIQMYDFQWDENYIYIIMEYCEGGDLSGFIKTYKHLRENICKSFLCQLASAIEFLRQHNIVHMDLKPQNLLLTNRLQPVLKLTDFGLAQSLKNREKETSLRGSPLYMAPEILMQKSYDASVDLWSTGIILYECLFGKPPYTSRSLKDLVVQIKSDSPVTIPTTVVISSDCRNLLIRLLQKDPKKRATFEEFFKHPFVNLSKSSELEVDSIFERAKRLERMNRASEALIVYREAAALLSHLIQVETDSAIKSRLEEKVSTCSRRIVELSNSQSSINNTLTSSTIPLVHSTSSNETATRVPPHHELHSLVSATPSLLSSLQIGIEGVQYDGEGHSVLALERYKAALEIMIPLLRKESKGRRKDLLHQQATLWMDRAEQIQKLIDRQQSEIEELQCEDAGQCSLQ